MAAGWVTVLDRVDRPRPQEELQVDQLLQLDTLQSRTETETGFEQLLKLDNWQSRSE